MSCHRYEKVFETVEVRIDCCDKEELINLENSIVTSINQKLDKLNILIKNCDIYCGNGMLLVNDRYNICSDLTAVAEAFGLNIKQIQCGLKGKNYVISDGLLSTLKQLERNYEFGSTIANKEIDDVVKAILKEHELNHDIDSDLLEMIRNIKQNGQYVTTKTREVVNDYYDGRLVDSSSGEWKSNESAVRTKLMMLSKDAQEIVNNTNKQLRDGTAKLIYSRARQMGYAVQEVKKGTQTQLVLVRCE